MNKKEKNYKYLLTLYALVDEYLAKVPAKQENLPEIVVAFCVVTEKILKIRLHKRNPVLAYENAKMKEDDALVSIIKRKELDIETIKLRKTLNRYQLVFNGKFSDDEIQVINDLYKLRNHFLHGHKSDDDILSDKENIVKKMGTVCVGISAQAISTFGKDVIKSNKPKKKYSETELKNVLIEEVKKKIERRKGVGLSISPYIHNDFDSLYSTSFEKCPRCGANGFSIDDSNSCFTGTFIASMNYGASDLYRCKSCNLELTRKEYEIAKELI
ncbi:hypothetical protein HOG48_00365 [Candidatus Peregrinibacteria bacterium]|jgi:hypothetical protein|nr:hypothetical protein [Candidatus Peregrinibacteria bacterium]